MILTDKQIKQLCNHANSKAILPFVPNQVREKEDNYGDNLGKVISYGLSSMGYDIRLGSLEFKIFTPVSAMCIDPKDFDKKALQNAELHYDGEERFFLIPPNSYALGLSYEVFDIPEDVLGLVIGKSTYARCGLILNTTPLEPGWKGHLVLEFSNSASLPIKVYANEGVGQLLLFRAESRPEVTYGDRDGKYQGQRGLTLAKV